MKQIIFSLSFVFFITLQAQDYKAVDLRVSKYPQYRSAEGLAAQIQKDFTTDKERTRAIYAWLALNIDYDMQRYLSGDTVVGFSYTDDEDFKRKSAAIEEYSINSTLRNRKAVCEGYARTFKRVADLIGIPCLFIGGYSKTGATDIGKNPHQEDHAWNAVRIQNKWYLIDVTWGAGHSRGREWVRDYDDYYFFTNPSEFALTHLPGTADFSFTDKKMTKKEFFNTPVYNEYFFKNNLKLISPTQGKLTMKPGTAIKLTFGASAKNKKLYYAFAGEKYPKELVGNCSEGKCSYTIPFSKITSTQLYVIANRRTVLEYIIDVKR